MSTAEERLRSAQKAYNTFLAQSVEPILGSVPVDEDKRGFLDIAQAISDERTKQQYIRLAIELLEANVCVHQPLAERKTPPQSPDTTMPIVVTLLAAAAGYAGAGPVWALLAAAAGYYLARRSSEQRQQDQRRAADEHNNEAQSWQETVDDWKAALKQLRAEA